MPSAQLLVLEHSPSAQLLSFSALHRVPSAQLLVFKHLPSAQLLSFSALNHVLSAVDHVIFSRLLALSLLPDVVGLQLLPLSPPPSAGLVVGPPEL